MLWMMRGGTVTILGNGVKVQGQLRQSVYKTLWTRFSTFVQSLSNFTCTFTFKFHMHVVDDEIDFRSKVRVNSGSLCIRL